MTSSHGSPLRKAPNRMPAAADRDQRRAPTASTLIQGELRASIASLRLLPGQAINEREIAAGYGVSRTPVHEAVLKLAEEGLIAIFPQAGTFVARIPLHALPEGIIIRRALEETSARLAAANAQPDDISAIEHTLQDLRRAAEQGDRQAFHQSDEDFHEAVAAAAGYPGLWRVTQQVKVQVDRFRRLTLPQEGRMARVLAEHQAVLSAIRDGDGARAQAAMGDHLGGLLADLGGIAGLNPDHFDMTQHNVRPQSRAANIHGGPSV
jgi:DNA-binding GntR family transcriptional regulator